MDLQQLKEDLVFQKEFSDDWNGADYQICIQHQEYKILNIVKHRLGTFSVMNRIVPEKWSYVSKNEVYDMLMDLIEAVDDCSYSDADYEYWVSFMETLASIFQGEVEED